MSIDERNNSKDEELSNLPERPVTEAEQVKGGAIPKPGGPVPIPYPNVKTSSAIRSIEPCF